MRNILIKRRGYLNESAQAQQPQKFPEKIYYGVPMSHLDSIRDTGVVNLPRPQDVQHNKIGVPTCNSPADAFGYGEVQENI